MVVADIMARLAAIHPGEKVVIQHGAGPEYLTITGVVQYKDKFDGETPPGEGDEGAEFDDVGEPMLPDTVIIRID
jgi:hypothetical protein